MSWAAKLTTLETWRTTPPVVEDATLATTASAITVSEDFINSMISLGIPEATMSAEKDGGIIFSYSHGFGNALKSLKFNCVGDSCIVQIFTLDPVYLDIIELDLLYAWMQENQ